MANNYSVISDRINGTSLSLLGVIHDYETFNQHKHRIEGFIHDNEAVVLERVPRQDFWHHEEFFGRVAEIAMDEGKRVYQIDPRTLGNTALDFASIPIGELLIINGVKQSKKEISRRNFLFSSAKVAFGLSLISGTNLAKNCSYYINPDSLTSYGLDDIFGYGEQDYSNIAIAEGLERLSKELDFKKIGAVHGLWHNEAIYKYLTNPGKRKKRLLYLPHDLVGQTKIREYTPVSNEWKLTRTF